MSDKEALRQSDTRAAKLLLETYDVTEIDKDTTWLFQYTPKARLRGSGFEITISKKTGEVVNVEHYQ